MGARWPRNSAEPTTQRRVVDRTDDGADLVVGLAVAPEQTGPGDTSLVIVHEADARGEHRRERSLVHRSVPAVALLVAHRAAGPLVATVHVPQAPTNLRLGVALPV